MTSGLWYMTQYLNVAFQEKLVKLKTQALPKPEIILDGKEVKEVKQKLCSSDHSKWILPKSEVTFCVQQECTEKAVVFSVTTNLADPVITILRMQKISKSNKSWKLSNMKICMSKKQQPKTNDYQNIHQNFFLSLLLPPEYRSARSTAGLPKSMPCHVIIIVIISFFLLGCNHYRQVEEKFGRHLHPIHLNCIMYYQCHPNHKLK